MTPEQFKEARLKLGLTQPQLATLWGIGCGRTIRRWESGERPMNPLAAYALGLMVSNHSHIR